MMGSRVVTVLMVLVMVTKSECVANDEECDLLQYLSIGRNGTIQCSFSEFHAVSWFNIEEDTTILFYEKGVKPEDGDVSDDYDIYPNGSLFIRNVTLEHETIFRVTKVISVSKPIVSYEIRVRTIIPPPVPHPVIEQCQDNLTVCYAVQVQEDSSALSCFVQNVRPRISLVWNQRKADRDKPLLSEITIESRNNETFTSRSTVQISTKFPLLSVFVCSAEENAWLLEESETVVVLEKEGPGRMSETRKQYIELHTTMLLSCTNSEVQVIVWKRMVDTETTEEVILLRVKTWKSDFNETYNNDFRLNSDGSLLLRNTEWHHQGRYTCLVAEYTPEELHIDVIIFVMPVPRYLKIAGCDFQRYCVLKVNQGDVLTCSVHGIRPEVNLEWNVYAPNAKVSFLQENHRVHPNGDNYDITLTSTITFTPAAENRVTVECRVVGTNADIFNLSQTIDLLIPNVQANSNNTGVLTAVITVAIIVIVTVILMIGGILLRKVIHSNHSQEGRNLYEAIPMMSPTETNKLDQLITELKGKYKLLYDAVQPIPYIRDRMICVDKVFVEGGIEYLEKTSGTSSNDIWKPLASYRELFDKINDETKRQILEGEPGYGKSTLTLQLAYDWCNNISNSPISKVKTVVFLRLRQLGGVQSIYDAIKKFILAKDSKFTEDDVKSLLNESGSVLLILDGYDEYPDQDNMDTDVSLIIKKEILRDIDVILTTRSSYLPKHRVPQTSRIRLRGFDETARDQYIRKAVVGDDNEDEIEKIKLKLKRNLVLGDMCDVPLFFVMFAHITHESEDFETFHSVTGFFRYMISCFHSHLRNKMRDENVKMSEAHENDHSLLDKVAFEALSGYRQKIVWKKEQLRKLFGEEFYNQYIRVGILVEDDVLDCDAGRAAEFHAQYIVEVRFYHKLFCEWYAAHYLARNVSKLSSNADQLLGNLDPYDLQYVYRFACGLNKDASEHIIKYLQRTDEGQKFAILCILEQEDNMQNLVEIVTKLVSNNVEIDQYDSRLLQRSTLQILEFASKKKIPITCLTLKQSYKKCEESNIVLHSGLTLTYLSTLENMQIEMEKDGERQEPKSLSEEEIKAIFKYVIRSRNFKKLSFEGCLLPITLSSDSIPADMQSRDIKVFWNDYGYILNLQSGVWKVDDVDTVKRICTENVNIFRDDSELLQKCTIQLLENASYYDIPITCLNLNQSYKKCEESNIVLHSGLTLNYLSTLENIHIVMETKKKTQEPRSLSEEEINTIFQYMLRCKACMKLSFSRLQLPTSVSPEAIPNIMKTRNIRVCWRLFDIDFHLDLQNGHWEVDNIDTLRQRCSDNIRICKSDDILKQTFTVMFIHSASRQEIPISCLYLQESFSRTDAGEVILHSGLRLSCPVSVKKILISTFLEGREMTETEVIDILMFVQQSHMLEELKFRYCLLPQSIPAETIPSILKTRNVKVSWAHTHPILYTLNLQSGRWMHRDTRQEITDTEYNDTHRDTRQEITDTEYNDTVRNFRTRWGDTEWQKARLAAETK